MRTRAAVPVRSDIRKVPTVSTTINEIVDRRGGAYSEDELEDVLNRSRKILADISALLDLEVERLFEMPVDSLSDDQIKQIRGLIAQTQKGMQQILDIETRAGLHMLVGGRELDLDQAREEVLRRIARIAV